LGVIAEIVLFAYSGRLMMRFSPSRLIFIGALAAIVRWAAMAFDPPLALLAPLQLLHAFTFGAAHLGAVHFISEAAPQRVAATAQAIYASISSGIVTGAVILASGPLYHAYGGAGYGVMALLALFSAGAAFQLDRLWRRGFLAPDQRYLLAPPHKVGDKSV
jgi:PPP family 3-phenylpropionic acid transporter